MDFSVSASKNAENHAEHPKTVTFYGINRPYSRMYPHISSNIARDAETLCFCKDFRLNSRISDRIEGKRDSEGQLKTLKEDFLLFSRYRLYPLAHLTSVYGILSVAPGARSIPITNCY